MGTVFVVQKKPDIGSVEDVSGQASSVAPLLMALLMIDHSNLPHNSTHSDAVARNDFPQTTACQAN